MPDMASIPAQSQPQARLAALAGRAAITRGERFLSRSGAQGLPIASLADVLHLPAWLLSPRPLQTRIAMAAALLLHRPSLDRELSGTRLAVLAGLVGETLFDAVCAEPLAGATWAPACADSGAALPPPAQLAASGRVMLERTLAPPLGPEQPQEPMLALADVATRLVLTSAAAEDESAAADERIEREQEPQPEAEAAA